MNNYESSELPLFSFNLYKLLDEVRNEFFEQLSELKVEICIRPTKSVASITKIEDNRTLIYLHSFINSAFVPKYIIKGILIHELLHQVVTPVDINGEIEDHPPEFYEIESTINPLAKRMYNWIFAIHIDFIKIDQDKKGATVLKKWKKNKFTKKKIQAYEKMLDAFELDGKTRNNKPSSGF